MREERIIVTFDEAGGSSIEVHGAEGHTCLALTADLERALGTVETRRKKPAFYATTENATRVTAGRSQK